MVDKCIIWCLAIIFSNLFQDYKEIWRPYSQSCHWFHADNTARLFNYMAQLLNIHTKYYHWNRLLKLIQILFPWLHYITPQLVVCIGLSHLLWYRDSISPDQQNCQLHFSSSSLLMSLGRQQQKCLFPCLSCVTLNDVSGIHTLCNCLESKLLHFQFSYLLMCRRKQWKMAPVHRPLHLCGRCRNSWLPTADWPSSNTVAIGGVKQRMDDTCVSPSVSVILPFKQLNTSSKIKISTQLKTKHY